MRKILIFYLILILSQSIAQKTTGLRGKYKAEFDSSMFYRSYVFNIDKFVYEYHTDAFYSKMSGSFYFKKLVGDSGIIVFHFEKNLPIPNNAYVNNKENKIDKFEKLEIKNITSDSFMMKPAGFTDYVLFKRDTTQQE